ncbi:hypothetical protein YC2023_072488 [Brassica napus]
MVETRLGKRKDRPPPTAPPPQKSGTSKNSKKNKPKKSSKKRKTTDEESPAVDFVGTVGVAEENEVEEPAKDVEDREKEKTKMETKMKRKKEIAMNLKKRKTKMETKMKRKKEIAMKKGQNENENQEQGEPPLEAELGNVDGDGEGVLGQGEEELEATEAIKPLRMYFYESEYKKQIKLATKCFVKDVMVTFDNLEPPMRKGARDVLEFFQRAVDDLEFCENFPWGRYSFDYMVKEISHTIDHFGGRVREKTLWPLPGFCLPLELLAFEAIPKLGLKFRKEVEDVDVDCPRMYRSVFKSAGMKGFSLSKLNRELDKLDKITSRDIHSILPTKTEEEVALLEEMTEEEDDVDVDDISVDSWVKRLAEGHSVFFEEMYDVDVAARDPNAQEAVDEDQDDEEGGEEGGASQKKMMEELIKQVKMFGTQLKRVKKTMDKFEERMVVPFEAFMKKAMDEGQGSRE